MSLITRCPVCQTLFKVVPDQLRISEGWVRCGQCDEAFDASLHFVQSLVPENVASVPQNSKDLREEVLPPQKTFTTASPAPDTDVVMSAPSLADEWSAPEAPVGLVSEGQPFSQPTPHLETPVPAAQAGQAKLVQAAPLLRKASDDLEPDSYPASTASTASNEVSFLRQRRSPATGSSLLMRAALVCLNLALVLGLAGQIVLQERDRIAAFEPDLQPWLQVICDRLDCKLSPWKKIEMIVIDSSAFTRVRDDSYRLSLTLKNTATAPVGMPVLELTLTDTLDQPVIRRVLSKPEIDSGSDAIAAGMEFPVVVTVAVNPGGGVDRIAGYRLLAFYP